MTEPMRVWILCTQDVRNVRHNQSFQICYCYMTDGQMTICLNIKLQLDTECLH